MENATKRENIGRLLWKMVFMLYGDIDALLSIMIGRKQGKHLYFHIFPSEIIFMDREFFYKKESLSILWKTHI